MVIGKKKTSMKEMAPLNGIETLDTTMATYATTRRAKQVFLFFIKPVDKQAHHHHNNGGRSQDDKQTGMNDLDDIGGEFDRGNGHIG